MKRFLLFGLILMAFACSNKKCHVPESLVGIKEIISQIDSTVVAMYGWKPQDSTYSAVNDTLVVSIVNAYHQHRLIQADSLSVDQYHESCQQVSDDACITWNKFKALCDDEKFEEALDFYFGDSSDDARPNSGDFLVFLKHSSHRYVFFSEVLWPLMMEFKGERFATNKYIEMLQLEKMMEDLTIAIHTETDEYVPEVYPYVVKDLGFTLARSGKMDEAQDLFEDLINGVFLITDNALFSDFIGVQYCAQLYMQEGNSDMAIASWLDFKAYLEEYKSEYPEDAWQEYMDKVDAELQSIGD